MIYRLFVEKKKPYAVRAERCANEIFDVLGIKVLEARIFIRYDIDLIKEGELKKARNSVFSEPPVDIVYDNELPDLSDYKVFAIEYLPGQFDQRADSAAQCVQLLTKKNRPIVRCATVYAFKGIDDDQLVKIKNLLINPVDSHEADLKPRESLEIATSAPKPPQLLKGFILKDKQALKEFYDEQGFSMSLMDLEFVQKFFKDNMRDPTETELKVLDTYWSDHCRHTTFNTNLEKIKIQSKNGHIKKALELYEMLFLKFHHGKLNKKPSLMDMATIGAKELLSQGRLLNLDISEEINACSINVQADVDGKPEDWLVMFKNETHNHPTEIEPFGGAATCLGGCIRDPLSGRSYAYQAMRFTGAGDITESVDKTLEGKLPQRVLTQGAAAGFCSYGNQIGLATGLVNEVFHKGYKAKRLECGFVVGAAPLNAVLRFAPEKGDLILLVGGETGRDGCGGATGSSKAHTAESLSVAGAEVQKGNPPEERKLQRLFRRKEATRLIKRCNDFGAGGVSVAVGELADGVDIYLDLIEKKYDGLSATELAISESQERMAVVVREEDVEEFYRLASEENLRATVIGRVTDLNKMRAFYDNKLIVELDRSFLNTHGVKQSAEVVIKDEITDFFDEPSAQAKAFLAKGDLKNAALSELKRLGVCSQKGLVEMFDSTVGAGTVLMPFGGRTQLTPSISMAAKLPVLHGNTDTATVCSYGFNPDLMESTPFVGAVYSILLSVLKVAVTGGFYDSINLTLQEYFPRLRKDPVRWGLPTSAMLGALAAQYGLKLGAIGGKDSMSGSFEDIDVPPTLISFALGVADANNIIDNVLKNEGEKVYLLRQKRDKTGMPDLEYAAELAKFVQNEIFRKHIRFATVVEEGGAFAAAVKSCLGNELGFDFALQGEEIFCPRLGDILITTEHPEFVRDFKGVLLGTTNKEGNFNIGGITITQNEAVGAFTRTLEGVFPTNVKFDNGQKAAERLDIPTISFSGEVSRKKSRGKKNDKEKERPVDEDGEFINSLRELGKPRVFIPVFPGTNCEYDTAKRFELAGAVPHILVIKNRTPEDVAASIDEIVKCIHNSQIVAFPGGFSGGDEPDGSGKFIAATFRNPKIKEALNNLLKKRDGLMLGICNGFQALMKMGLLPYGEIKELNENSPTLTFNSINRHVSTVSRIRVASCISPWFANVKVGQEYAVAVSHGEGRFVASEADLEKMMKNGQICTQYVNNKNVATMEMPFNPNGSVLAIEGITSPDGRILGKMGHSERIGSNIMKNIELKSDMKIFEAGVKYFK